MTPLDAGSAITVPRFTMLNMVCDALGLQNNSTFTARFEMLGRMGFLPHNRHGRGRRAAYSQSDALHTIVAFDLIDVGVTPETLIALFDDGLANLIGKSLSAGEDLTLNPQRLSQFRIVPSQSAPSITLPVYTRHLHLTKAWLDRTSAELAEIEPRADVVRQVVAPVGVTHVRVRVLPDGRVSRADASAFLGYSPKTMADWFSKGTGPRPRKVGGRVFYLMKDLEAFRDTGAREADNS